MGSCTVLKQPVIVKKSSIETFKYAYITPTKTLTSSEGALLGGYGIYGIFGASETSSINPSDVIASVLINKGFIILPEITPELVSETIIVNYGENEGTYVLFGYTTEVTIQFLSAETKELICYCTAEGQGETKTGSIRNAINSALGNLLP